MWELEMKSDEQFQKNEEVLCLLRLTHMFFMFFHLEGRKTACRNVSNIFWMVGDGEAVHIR